MNLLPIIAGEGRPPASTYTARGQSVLSESRVDDLRSRAEYFRRRGQSDPKRRTSHSDGRSGWRRLLTLFLHIYSPELLYPLACIHLGGEDVALAIDGDAVKRREHAHLASRPTEAAERLL